jgi:hypothetical protein
MSEIIFIGFCYIILFGFIYYLSYCKYSALVKLPFYILSILLITYVTYVISEYWSEDETKSTGKKQLFEIFQRFFIIYGEYILVIIVVFIIFLVLHNVFMGILVFSLSKSLWITLGFVILILALLKKTIYKTSEDSDLMILLKDIIFYIPCLITDAIDFIKKDYVNTPSTTFIVFILIIIYSIIFFLVPLINTDGGILIVSGPQNLNTVTRLSTDEILILNNLPTHSYDKNNFVYNDISFAIPTNNKLYPRDKLTQKLEAFTNKESFVGLIQQDTNYNFSFGKKKNEEQIEEINISKLYRQVTEHVTHNYHSLYSIYQAITSLFKSTQTSPYPYNYGLSFWLFINTFHFNQQAPKMQYIVSFGSKLSLMYDNIENVVVILLEDEEVYRSTQILYQRWNHIVINSNDSKLDLFINNNLVGTYNYNHASTVDLYDSLVIGSIDNNNFGNVCNFRYYPNILDLSKIKSIYTKYNKKTPPL